MPWPSGHMAPLLTVTAAKVCSGLEKWSALVLQPSPIHLIVDDLHYQTQPMEMSSAVSGRFFFILSFIHKLRAFTGNHI